jgi:uncharacterized protein (TIGR03067 family)|uniref:SHD1 domain-containing protein n=1 Tax=Prosthecobacter sp. TaxID=1965333 RepID=UPI0037834EB8
MKTTLLLVSLLLGSTLQARTWTEASSGRSVEADFVRVDGETVVMRMSNGATTQFPIARLSAADQEFIKQQAGAPSGSSTKTNSASVEKSDSTESSSKDDVKKQLLGTWDGYMADSDGSKHGDIRLVITEDKITASNPQGNREMGAGTYKISGKRIDATGTEGQFSGKKYEGIFDLDGKTLKWCSANDNPNSSRPSKLQTNTQAGQFLMVLEKK